MYICAAIEKLDEGIERNTNYFQANIQIVLKRRRKKTIAEINRYYHDRIITDLYNLLDSALIFREALLNKARRIGIAVVSSSSHTLRVREVLVTLCSFYCEVNETKTIETHHRAFIDTSLKAPI